MSQSPPPAAENPYEPPSEPASDQAQGLFFSFAKDSPEALRETYGAHEASVRAISIYYFLGFAFSLFTVVLALASPRFSETVLGRTPREMRLAPEFVRTMLIVAGLFGAGFHWVLGYCLRRLHNWARWVAVVYSGIGVLGIVQSIALQQGGDSLDSLFGAFRMILNLYVIWILLSSNSGVIMTEKYRRAAAQTPKLVPRPRVRDWVFLGSAALFYTRAFINLIRAL